jgi:hypothetical protein
VAFEPVAQGGAGGVNGGFDGREVLGDELVGGLAFVESSFEGEAGLGNGSYAKGCTGGSEAVSGSAEQPQVRTGSPKGIETGGQASEVTVDYSTQHRRVAPEGDVQLVEDTVVNGGGHQD